MAKETISSEFLGREKGNNRWVYKFANLKNPKDLTKPMKITVFEPNVPELKEGEEYEFGVENVPMKDNPTSFHHNMTRKANNEYNIGLPDICQPEPNLGTPEKIGKNGSEGGLNVQKSEQITHQIIDAKTDSINVSKTSTGKYSFDCKIYAHDLNNADQIIEKIAGIIGKLEKKFPNEPKI